MKLLVLISVLFLATATSCKKEDEPCQISVSVETFLDGEAILAEAYHGLEPVTFQWSNGAQSQAIQPLSDGDYTVTVTDALGCTATATYTNFSAVCPDTIYDSDGNLYLVKKVAGRCWTTTNLINLKGGSIPAITDSADWVDAVSAAFCYVNNDPLTEETGILYNYYAVDSFQLCPDGFHVPTKADWEQVINHYGGYLVAADDLMTDPSLGLTFSGYRFYGEFIDVGAGGEYWSSTDDGDPFHAWGYDIYPGSTVISDAYLDAHNGLTCRCIND